MNFDFSSDPDPAFHSIANQYPGPASKNKPDPDPQPWILDRYAH